MSRRRSLIATAVAFVAAAALAIGSGTLADQGQPILEATPGPVLPLPPSTRTARPELPEVAVSRRAAVGFGQMRAAAFGEESPELVDAAEMTLAEARRKVSPEGGPLEWPVEGQSIAADEDRVWLVRMRGTFYPPHGPEIPRESQGERGWMYTIVHVETGQTIASGFRPNAMPLR